MDPDPDSCIKTSVVDPHHLNADPDPTYHFGADPDPTYHFDADPDPTSHFDADQDFYLMRVRILIFI